MFAISHISMKVVHPRRLIKLRKKHSFADSLLHSSGGFFKRGSGLRRLNKETRKRVNRPATDFIVVMGVSGMRLGIRMARQ